MPLSYQIATCDEPIDKSSQIETIPNLEKCQHFSFLNSTSYRPRSILDGGLVSYPSPPLKAGIHEGPIYEPRRTQPKYFQIEESASTFLYGESWPHLNEGACVGCRHLQCVKRVKDVESASARVPVRTQC